MNVDCVEEARILSLKGNEEEALLILERYLVNRFDKRAMEIQYATMQIFNGNREISNHVSAQNYAVNLIFRSIFQTQDYTYILDSIDYLCEIKLYSKALICCNNFIKNLRQDSSMEFGNKIDMFRSIAERVRSIKTEGADIDGR